MNYTQLLLNGVKLTSDSDVCDIPLLIHTVDATYPLSFIDFEENDSLGVNYTSEDGTERFVILNKRHIVDVEVIYKDDIHVFMKSDDEEEKSDVMYQ